MLEFLLYYGSAALVLAVGVVLLLGLRTLLSGGNPSLSQHLMRWRIGLQSVAVIMIVFYGMLRNPPV